MIKHTMDVIRNAVQHLNPGQTPVVTFDQPLFALAKQIQWKWPEEYGEQKFVIVFGGLHIETTALKTLQRRAYDHYLELSDKRDEELEFDDWCQQRAKTVSYTHLTLPTKRIV